MVLSSSGGGSRINRARVTYGGRGRAGGLLHLKKPPTTSSLTSLPDESDDDDDSSSDSSSSEDDEGKVGKMLVEKKEKVKATRTAAPWKKAGPAAVKKEPLRQHAANTAHAAPTKPTPLKVSVPAPHAASSSSLSSVPSSSAASASSTSSRKASLAAQRKVQRILSFEEEEKKRADDQEKQTRRPSRTETAAHDAAEDVADKLEQQLRLSDDEDTASEPANGLASLLAACSQRQPLAFDDALQRILGGSTTSHLLSVEKAGDASYSKVYRLTKRVTREDIDWEESSILKVIPLRDGDEADAAEATSETSSCADVEREIAITRALCSTQSNDGQSTQGRFVELRGAYVAEGPLAAVLSDIDGDNDDSGHASDHQQRKAGKNGRRARASSPRSSSSTSSPTLYALLDLSDCGVDLESYALPSSSSSSSSSATLVALSILTQVIDSLAIAEDRYQFEHRDLHWGNVLVRNVARSTPSPPSLTWPGLIDSHHTGVEATIIDFTLSRLTETDGAAPRYYDLAVDPSLFEGDGGVDEQFDVYRGMRDVVQQGKGEGTEEAGGWQRFEPRTNVLWARYLVRKLLDGKGLRREGQSDGALEMIEAVESVLNESVEHFLKSSRSVKEEGRVESMVQLRDWMAREMEGRAPQQEEKKEKKQEEEQARRPRARQQSQRPRKAAAAATKEDGPTRRRSVRR